MLYSEAKRFRDFDCARAILEDMVSIPTREALVSSKERELVLAEAREDFASCQILITELKALNEALEATVSKHQQARRKSTQTSIFPSFPHFHPFSIFVFLSYKFGS